MALANECIPFYEPGQRITGRAKAAIVGKRLVDISGNREDGLIGIAHATAAGKAFGVASHSAADGENVTVIGSGAVVPVTATAAAIDAGDEVEVGADGKVLALASGVAVGVCVNGALANADAEIKLY
jgi:predicted RecA/RadA family phage recombinase